MEGLKKNSGFIMRPYSMFQSGEFSRAKIAVAGQIFSMTQKENVCKWGYSTFCEKLNMAKSTVADAVRKLCEDGWFARERRGGKTNEYTYTGDGELRGHVRTENFFYTEKVKIFGVERYLNLSEVDVLSLIYVHTRHEKTGKFEGATKTIAEILGLSERTVRRAIKALLNAKLIFRPEKGVNKHVSNVFAANMKWIRAMERAHKRAERKASAAQKQVPKEVIDANARADREKFYAERQQAAQAKAERYLAMAKADARFVTLEKELRPFPLLIPKTERENAAQLPALLAKQKALKEQRAAVLQEHGLAYWMLSAKNHAVCKQCFDTGYRPNGASCDCYTRRI